MWNKALSLFGGFMVIIYILIGLLFLSAPDFIQGFNETYRIIFGAALILYGIFRGYQTYKKFRESDDENEEDNE